MGGILSRLGVNVRSVWRSDRGSEVIDPDRELQQHQFEAAVIEATDTGNVEMLKYLHDQECLLFWGGIDSIVAKPPLLHRATAKGHKSVVEYLLELGLDVEETDSSGMTVLHVACKMQRNLCLPPLMHKSRDIDRRDIWGRTPLIKALVYRNVEAARMLLERGANPNATDMYGMTPLTTAIDYDMMDVVGLLVDHGADINLINHPYHGKCSGPPLYLAINNQNLPMIQQLLRLGAATQPRIQDYQFYPNSKNGNNNNNNGGIGSNNSTSQTTWSYIVFGSNNNNNNNNNNQNNTVNNNNNNNNDHYPGGNASSPLSPSLQHSNAVSLCMYELLRHDAENHNSLSESSLGIKILLEVLGAHGYPLGPAPDVLIRVLLNNSLIYNNFSMLLYKLQICSATASEDLLMRMILSQKQTEGEQIHSGGGGDGNNGEEGRRFGRDGIWRRGGGEIGGGGRAFSTPFDNQLLKRPPRLVSSLQNQSRRVIRKALMDSGAHNVLWACGPLQCPPALKTLLLLKDVDRAFGNQGQTQYGHQRKVKTSL